MNKKFELIWFKFLSFKGLKDNQSTTLVELMICLVIIATIVLSLFSLETFSHSQVISADRRSKVQNTLAYCLEHMSKYVEQAGGNNNIGYPAIALYPAAGAKTGFQVRVDFNNPRTPAIPSDDAVVYYSLNSSLHTITTACSGTCGSFISEVLTRKIVGGFNNSVPASISANPTMATDGFFVVVDPLGNYVDIGLIGRYDPEEATSTINPQIGMKTRLICNNSSTN